MANPMKDEDQIYKKIREENIRIHPLIWELIDHHIRNDLYIINLIVGIAMLDKRPLTNEEAENILAHTRAIKDFLTKLGKETRKGSEPIDE